MSEEASYFFAMTAEDAELYFQRCIEREAVKESERLDILIEMNREKKLLAHGPITPILGKALGEFFTKTKHKGILAIKKKQEPDIDPENRKHDA